MNSRGEIDAWPIVAFAIVSVSIPANAHGGEVAVLLGVVVGLLIGGIPGFWVGARGYKRASGHPWLIGVVAAIAVAGLFIYTVGGPPNELFTRLVMLPLSLLIAIASAAILVGVPMYASYLLGHRVGQWATNSRRIAEREDGTP